MPCPFETVRRVKPVFISASRTSAPETALPLESRIVPEISPLFVACAQAQFEPAAMKRIKCEALLPKTIRAASHGFKPNKIIPLKPEKFTWFEGTLQPHILR